MGNTTAQRMESRLPLHPEPGQRITRLDATERSTKRGVMTAASVGTGRVGNRAATEHRVRRISTETKASFKTTEFLAYILAAAGVIVMSALVGTNSGHDHYFRAD
jgi:hypothetical protein